MIDSILCRVHEWDSDADGYCISCGTPRMVVLEVKELRNKILKLITEIESNVSDQTIVRWWIVELKKDILAVSDIGNPTSLLGEIEKLNLGEF